jgi:hypothetical protein
LVFLEAGERLKGFNFLFFVKLYELKLSVDNQGCKR